MMSDKEFHEAIFVLNHKPDCDFWCDQYWWECSCGAITAEIREQHAQRRRDERCTND